MKNFIGVLSLLALALSLGCRTTKDVMPGADGNNRVALSSSDGQGGRSKAIKEAKRYCENKGKEAVFTGDKTSYTGSMDEDTRNTIRNASNAAMVVGGMARNGETSPLVDPGGVLPAAGMAGYAMTSGNDYEVEVKFKCQ